MNGKHIAKLGLTGADIGLALAATALHEDAGASRDEILGELAGVQASPAEYSEALNYRVWGAEPGATYVAGSRRQFNSRLRY